MAMSLHRIVKHLNEIESLASGFVTCWIDLFLGDSFFKRGKETLGNGIVPAITLPAHAANELVLGQNGFEVIAGILAATIRMTDTTLQRVASQNCLEVMTLLIDL